MMGAICASPSSERRTYRAPMGGAIVVSCSLLHEATPVIRGKRYAFLPFLYDEAGEQLGRQNARFLADDRGEESNSLGGQED